MVREIVPRVGSTTSAVLPSRAIVGVPSTQPRKLSWHALVVGPLSPPACLSLKSWPDRSDPVHLIASGTGFCETGSISKGAGRPNLA